jgi:hypothetical protein
MEATVSYRSARSLNSSRSIALRALFAMSR